MTVIILRLENMLRIGAYCHHDYRELDVLMNKFLNYNGNELAVMCIWGHSYEFMVNGNWERLESICRIVSGRDDVFYGLNSEVYLHD